MSHSIDNCLANHFRWHLVGNWRLNALGAGSDSKIDFGEHKINSLIYQIKDCSFVNPVKGNRLCYLNAMKMGALDLGGNKEALRVFSKDRHHQRL